MSYSRAGPDTVIPDGATRVFVIIGDPVAQARAPSVWSALFAAQGINAICVPLRVAPEGLATALDGIRAMKNIDGITITVPHKVAAVSHVDHLSARAARVEAVNVMRPLPDGSWSGDILDGIGFTSGLLAHGVALAGRRVLLVGAGGAGRAIAFALVDAGVAVLRLHDAQSDRARGLCTRLHDTAAALDVSVAASPDPADVDIAINATPMGLRPDDPLPLPVERLASGTIVADVIMKPLSTPLLRAAAARGCRVHHGRHMMDHQIAHAATFFGLDDGDWSAAAVARAMRARGDGVEEEDRQGGGA